MAQTVFFIPDIIIGFSEIERTVSEADAGDEDSFEVPVGIHSKVLSEIEFEVAIRVVVYDLATVVARDSSSTRWDAQFGAAQGNRLVVTTRLKPGTLYLPDVMILVRNDLQSELEEKCCRISIEKTDFFRTTFDCEKSPNANYSCDFTLCILDNDGEFSTLPYYVLCTWSCLTVYDLLRHTTDPFVVAFVETVYSVGEGNGSVEVCVNLTQPQKDIQDEVVKVEVLDDSDSVYIPPGSPLASECALRYCISLH